MAGGGGTGSGGGGGGGGGEYIPAAYDQAATYPNEPRRLTEWPHRRLNQQSATVVPNNEMYRINLELNAANQVLRQEADIKARQDTARRQMTTPHREELRSIVQHFHQATQQPTPIPAPPQDNSQLIGALQTITQQNHALGRILEEKNMSAQQMVELAHHSMQAQASVQAQTGPNAPVPAPRMPRSRSPLERKVEKKDTRMTITQPASVGRQPSPSEAAIQAEMQTDPRLFSNVQPEPARILPPSVPSRILPESNDPPRILPEPNVPSRSRSKEPKIKPKLPKQTIQVAPAASSSQGEDGGH
jgi:hypothetical protein